MKCSMCGTGVAAHRGREAGAAAVVVVAPEAAHELQVPPVLLQLRHVLLALLQPPLGPRQLVPQPLVLLAQPAHLGAELVALRLH